MAKRGSDGASAPVERSRKAFSKLQRSLIEHERRNGQADKGRVARREQLISDALHGTGTHPTGDTREP